MAKIKMMKSILLAFCLLFSIAAFAQTDELYLRKTLHHLGDSLPYRLLLPIGYDKSKEYPLILFLHGAGERGNDNSSQLVHGAALFANDSVRRQFPAIVIFPQCPQNSFWSNVQFVQDTTTGQRIFNFQNGREPTQAMILLLQLLNTVQRDYAVDSKRIYVGGLSMGGMGTFEIVSRRPQVFAAAFPICGGGSVEAAKRMKHPAWWIFHGAKDDVVPPSLSVAMAAALRQAGAKPKLTLYPQANHNSWDNAFAEKDLLPWLFSQHK